MRLGRLCCTPVLMVVLSCGPVFPGAIAPTQDWPMYRGDALGDGHPPAALLSPSETPRLTLRWQRNLGAPVDGTPAVSGGVVVAGSANGKLAAYTLDNGARVWEDTGLGTIGGSAAIVGEQVLIGTLTGQVYAISLRDGSIQWTWRAPQSAAIWSSPVPYRNMVLGERPLSTVTSLSSRAG